MATYAVSLALAALLTGAPGAPEPASYDLPELARRTKPAVVHLSVRDASGRERGSGSGFFVAGSGVIATNHHVIAGARELRAKLSDGRELDVLGVRASDEDHDVALVEVAKPDGAPSYPHLALAESDSLSEGDRVAVIGSPLGLAGSISEGIYSSERESVGGIPGPWLQISAAISPGSSGSPVLDQRGRVVGVAVASMLGGQNVNLAVPVGFLRALMTRSADQPLKPVAPDGLPWTNLLVSAAFFAAIAGATVWTRRRRRGRR